MPAQTDKSSIWLNPRGAVFTGIYNAKGDSVDDPGNIDTGLSPIDRDIFYDPTDEEIDQYISQDLADGFNPMEMLQALPGAFGEIVNQIKETINQVPKTDMHKLPGTALEALLRAGSDTGDLLMRVGGGVGAMGFKALPGEASRQYHDLPEPMKAFARGYFRQRRTIEQHRAKQMMGDESYSYLPSALVDTKLAEGLSMFADPTAVVGFGTTTAFKTAAKAAAKGQATSLVSRGLINTAIKTGQMQEALFGAVTKVATSPVKGAAYLAREASSFAGEAIDQVKAKMPKRVSGEPIDVDLPQEGKIGWLRRGLTAAGNITDDAMELASEIKRQSKDVNLPGVLDRIARDTTVRSGARDMANVLSTLGRNPVSRGLLIPGYKVGKSVAKGATAGGMLGLLSFDEEFAANSIAGGAIFGPLGQLSSEIIFAKEKKAQQVDNFIDDFRLKLEPEDLVNFEEWTGGSREDAKFFAGLSYLFKNGHFKTGEGNLDIRFLNDEQYKKYGEVRGENFSGTVGVNYVSSGGRNTILINTSENRTSRATLAHELGHAIMKMPEVQDALMTQDKLLFGDRVVKMVNGKEVLTFNNEGLLTKKWIDAFYENYVNSLEPAMQAQYRAIKDEDKFLIARDEIYADSMREFFGKFDPESFIRAGKINNLKFRIGGSYERNLYNGLGGSAARGLIGNLLLARNSMGLYAIRNMGRAMGLIKEGEPLLLKDGRVFSNIADMLQKRRENISLVDDPSRDVIGTKWNAAQINSKDGREILSHFQSTIPLLRGEDGNPIIRNGRYQFQNKRQRQKADQERADMAKRAVDTTATSGESVDGLSMFQILENDAYRGDYFGKATIDAMLATSKRVFTPHLMDVIMRLNNRMRSRIQDSGFLIEFTYNQVQETGKITPDIITSYRQLVPMVFEMSKNGRNFRVTGLDMNDIMTRLDQFERAEKGTERAKIYDLWREEYRSKGGKDTDISLANNPVRGLFLQDLWLYLSGMSEGKTGIDALGGKGNTDADLVGVTQKRDGLMRFLGFERKDQMLSNENMFQQLVDKNRIIKSFRLDRLQNLTISDQPTTVTFGAFLGAQTNRSPGSLYSFKGSRGKDQEIPIEVVSGGKSEEARRIQAVVDKIGATAMTETIADGLLKELKSALAAVKANIQIIGIRTGQGGYKEAGSVNVAPNIVLSIRGDVAQGKQIMDALSLAWDQDGGNIVRKATQAEIKSSKVKKNGAILFKTSGLNAEQKKAFFNDLAELKDDSGESFLTGFTETSEGMFIGDQFYGDQMLTHIKKNISEIKDIIKKHKVNGYNYEQVIIDTFNRPENEADRPGILSKMTPLQRAVYDVAVNRVNSAVKEFQEPVLKRSAINIFKDFDSTLKEIESVKPGKPTMYEMASYLAERSARQGKLEAMTDRNARSLGDTIFEEASAALAKDADAVGWYDRKIDEAMSYLYEMHPELKDDTGLDSLFKSFIAVTSNGQDVRSNFKRANYLYEHYKKTGKILSDSDWGGQNKDAINAGLRNLNDLIQDVGGLKEAREFLLGSISVRDLNKYLVKKGIGKLTGELADHTVIGSMMFGPKIGSFYGNLNKLFDSVTMDRWFMRTINRIRGTLVDAPQGVLSQAKELAEVGKSELRPKVAKQLNKLIEDFQKPGFKGAKAYPILNNWLKATYRAIEKRKFKGRTELEKRAQRLHIYLKDINQAPSNGSERAWIRKAMAHAQARLKKEKNIDISNADLQAVLWYWEKDLYKGLNVGNKRAERADYADAARELRQSRG